MSPRRRRHGCARGLAGLLALGAIVVGATSATAAPLGTQARVSVTGADNDATFDATSPDVAYNPVTDQYLVVWSGSAGVAGETEIFGRLVYQDCLLFRHKSAPAVANGGR